MKDEHVPRRKKQRRGKRRRKRKSGGREDKPAGAPTDSGSENKPSQVTVSLLEQDATGSDSVPYLQQLKHLDSENATIDHDTTTQQIWSAWRQIQRATSSSSSSNQRSKRSRRPNWTQPTPIQRYLWPLLLETTVPVVSNRPTSCVSSSRPHVLAVAPTGSGKTLAYGLGLVLGTTTAAGVKNPSPPSIPPPSSFRGLVLVPTRELVLQVARELDWVARASETHETTHIVACHGGVSVQSQVERLIKALASGNNRTQLVVTATTGRWLDILRTLKADSDNQKDLLSPPEGIVLDEADRLASSSDLCQQVDSILQEHLKEEQSISTSARMVLCSATWPSKVTDQWKTWIGMVDNEKKRPCVVVQADTALRNNDTDPNPDMVGTTTSAVATLGDKEDETLSSEAGKDPGFNVTAPNGHAPSPPSTTSDCFARIPSHVVQTLHVCSQHKKPRKLILTLQKLQTQQPREQQRGIVFFQKIKTLQYISHFLQKQGIANIPLHGQLPWKDRQLALERFVSERKQQGHGSSLQLLLASPVAARGLDVPHVGFVINYDFPTNLEQYIHRCGRAGRGWSQQQGDGNGSSSAPPPTARVFSFFTRNLAPLAKDVVRLLEAHGQWVDPNLQALVTEDASPASSSDREEDAAAGDRSQRRRRSRNKTSHEDVKERKRAKTSTLYAHRNDSCNSDYDEFPELKGDRIVLKRAENVSDPSSSESSDDD